MTILYSLGYFVSFFSTLLPTPFPYLLSLKLWFEELFSQVDAFTDSSLCFLLWLEELNFSHRLIAGRWWIRSCQVEGRHGVGIWKQWSKQDNHYTNKAGELSGKITTYTLNEGNCAAQQWAPPRLEHLRAPPICGIASVIMWQVKRWHVWLWHVIWWCDKILWHVICWCDSKSHCIATCADLLQGWLPCSVQTHSSQGLYPEVTSSVHQRSVERRGCQIPSQGRRSLVCHLLMCGGEGSHCWNQSPPGYFVKNWIF